MLTIHVEQVHANAAKVDAILGELRIPLNAQSRAAFKKQWDKHLSPLCPKDALAITGDCFTACMQSSVCLCDAEGTVCLEFDAAAADLPGAALVTAPEAPALLSGGAGTLHLKACQGTVMLSSCQILSPISALWQTTPSPCKHTSKALRVRTSAVEV